MLSRQQSPTSCPPLAFFDPQASDRERLTHLETYLHERVVGQDAGTVPMVQMYCLLYRPQGLHLLPLPTESP